MCRALSAKNMFQFVDRSIPVHVLHDPSRKAWERCNILIHSVIEYSPKLFHDRDIALMNVVAKVHPETAALLFHFHIERNVRAKCIMDCRVNPKLKDVKVDEKEK
ncbi:hypothetical protein MTR_8g066510 [Medicago truncatula]|uniref:Uncharacterized protein n=1 Tax=Medicago truncatula TaxID=3880 RepID=G7LGZ4_MEDTR|nr:hypothetical protein MTR_8g066510 [Medicago truncatula]